VNGGADGIWASHPALNLPLDGEDHFRAFGVTDLYNAKYQTNVKRAWLIAFEDISISQGSDCDFNDLVAIVTEVDSTLITLSSFTAKASNGRAKLEWVTESELDNAGFNIYRAEAEDGEYVKLNDEIIPARGSETDGAKYVFIDKIAKNRKTYFYKLEDVDLFGVSTFHGPVSATPRFMNFFKK
jgi:hypothetical protein